MASVNYKSASNYEHKVRIIGGQWKRTVLHIPLGLTVRPSLSRVRETLFNWIEFFLDGQWSEQTCLDLFAGSGALGFEAASRGAKEVYLWEKERTLVSAMQNTARKIQATQLQIQTTDSLLNLERASVVGQQWDIIFCDPPFDASYYDRILPLVISVLREGGFLYCENQALIDFSLYPALTLLRSGRAGSVHYFLLAKNNLGAVS